MNVPVGMSAPKRNCQAATRLSNTKIPKMQWTIRKKILASVKMANAADITVARKYRQNGTDKDLGRKWNPLISARPKTAITTAPATTSGPVNSTLLNSNSGWALTRYKHTATGIIQPHSVKKL